MSGAAGGASGTGSGSGAGAGADAGGGRATSPRAVREWLAARGLKPKRGLGQNFLVDANVVRRIADAAELTRRDTALEIGPGVGALTEELAARAGRVVAVEVDAGLVALLRERFSEHERVHIVQADALATDLGAIVAPDAGRVKVVANLPYYITTPLLFHLLESVPFSVAVLMVQREVADRLRATPRSKTYGALTVGVQARCAVEWVGAVPPTVFFPQPDVSSAVVRLRRLAHPAVPGAGASRDAFRQVVRAAFAHRRKTLRRSLAYDAEALGITEGDIDAALSEAGIDGSRRAEALSVDDFARLTRSLAPRRAGAPR